MKSILTLSLLTISLFGMAQQHLPATLTLKLTDRQVLRIDSAINAASQQIDSKSFTNWYIKSFEPFYSEVRKQMIADTVKKKK